LRATSQQLTEVQGRNTDFDLEFMQQGPPKRKALKEAVRARLLRE
jgi:hypothetical protein